MTRAAEAPRPPGAALRLLLGLRVRTWRGAVRGAPPLQRRVGVLLTLSSLLLSGVILVASHALLVETARTGGPGALDALVRRVSLLVFLFLLAGGVPFVASTLLAPGDLPLLAAAPIRPTAVAAMRLVDAVVVASGQFVVIGVPLLVAAAWALRISAAGWLVFVAETLLLLSLPVFVVGALLLVLVRLLGLRRVRSVVAVTSAALSVATCLLAVREFSHAASRADAPGMGASAAAALRGGAAPAGGASSPWLPSDWVADVLIALGGGSPAAAVRPFLLLLGATAGLGGLCVALGGPTLVGERLLEGGGADAAAGRGWLDRGLALLPLSPPVRALVAKDVRYVVRDSVLLSQIGIPVILYFVPFVIGSQLGGGARGDLMLLSLGIVGTIAYMETSILSLSSVGLEGRSFWVVLAAPVSPALLVRAKWAFALLASLALAAPLLAGSLASYAAPALWAGAGLAGLVVACVALCGFGVGVAGLFPRFVYENPAHRASLSALIWGFVGATAYLLFCALVLGLGFGAAQQVPEYGGWVVSLSLLCFLFLSAATALLPLLAATRRLDGYAWDE